MTIYVRRKGLVRLLTLSHSLRGNTVPTWTGIVVGHQDPSFGWSAVVTYLGELHLA